MVGRAAAVAQGSGSSKARWEMAADMVLRGVQQRVRGSEV